MTDSIPAPGCASPAQGVPDGAFDCHSHIFGPFDRFPPLQPSAYALPEASAEVHAGIMDTLRVAYGVLTQPAPYAQDPAAMIDAIAQRPDRLRAVASASADLTDAELDQWTAGGVVGLRFVEMRPPGGQRYAGSVGFDQLAELAPRMAERGLHAQLWASAEDIVAWLPRFSRLGVPLVLDHMGCPTVAKGVADPVFTQLVEAVREQDIWVKLALCRVALADDPEAARPFHDELIAAAPERMLWGSDWPYVRLDPAPDAGKLLDRFLAWTGGGEARAILTENPVKLYRFGGV